MKSICLSCGAIKREAWKKCSACSFNPSADADAMVKSVYLSTGRFQEAEDIKAYEKELDVLASKLRNKESIEFDEEELARLSQQRADVLSVPPSAAWKVLFRFFLPSLIFIAVLVTAAIVIRKIF